ncbi:competence protein CoiA [Mesobacillus jeotgali]|uniref:competence protein CoiA n=1 Tax=Mesobacillus jeotgali TaxID=129985 RepID=UPI0009A90689|nr:competence protein CoiA family protein [Mesobacillus jeotgali]
MLVANKLNGERFSLVSDRPIKELKEIRSTEKFYCPDCGKEVIMKLGNKKIWHFSHIAGGSCEYEYDRETEYHLTGKLKLYDWLKQQGIHAELEKFDLQMRQKPDIAFEWKGQKYAIEFQCSVIHTDVFSKRTKTYLEYGVTPIWIAAEKLIKRKSNMIVSMNNFLYLFLRRSQNVWNIPAFCPITGQFINLHGVIPISTRKTITKLEVKTLNDFLLGDLIGPEASEFPLMRIWQKENQKLKLRYQTSPGARRNRFLKELYKNRLSLFGLPPVLGLPVQSSPYIETPSFIWQTYIYLDIFRHHKEGEIIYYSRIREAFARRIKKGDIKLRILPAAGQRDYWYALAEYVFLLTKVEYLEKIDSGKVKVLREKTIQNSNDNEAKFFAEYENKIEQLVFQ